MKALDMPFGELPVIFLNSVTGNVPFKFMDAEKETTGTREHRIIPLEKAVWTGFLLRKFQAPAVAYAA